MSDIDGSLNELQIVSACNISQVVGMKFVVEVDCGVITGDALGTVFEIGIGGGRTCCGDEPVE